MATSRMLLLLSIIAANLVLDLAASPVSDEDLLDDIILGLKQFQRLTEDSTKILPKKKKPVSTDSKLSGSHEEEGEISKRDRRLRCIYRDFWGRCRRYKKIGLWGK